MKLTIEAAGNTDVGLVCSNNFGRGLRRGKLGRPRCLQHNSEA
jgi:hypothetical protein